LRPAPFLTLVWANLLACSPGTDRYDNETGLARDTAAPAPSDSGGVTAPGLLSRLYLANTSELQLSSLAAGKAASPGVRRIARKLVHDHSRNREEQQALAQKLDVSLTPVALSEAAPDSGSLPPELEGKTAIEFDTAYLEHEIAAHQASVDEIQNRLLPVTQSPEVRAYLQRTLTAMQGHLEALKQVRQQLY
jgi:putative membrane protein